MAKDKVYGVTFVGDLFGLITDVIATDKSDAVQVANNQLYDEYGWQPYEVSFEVTAKRIKC